jgi:glycosyltransferase involved in cell wall biosynthesis
MKRDIVYLIGPSAETRGGIGYVIGTHLKSALADSHELIHIVTQRDGGPLIKAVTYAKALLRFALLRLFRGRGLVHIHSSIGPSFYRKVVLFYLCRWMGCPVIFQFHSGHFLQYYASGNRLIRFLIGDVLRSARLNVALTESWKQKITSLTDRCAPVEVIPNPIDTAIYRPGGAVNGQTRPAQLVYLGAIIKPKGAYDVVDACKLLKAQGLEPRVVMAGDREIEQAKERCRESGVAAQFEFPGWVSEKEKVALLWRSDLLLLPSYGEGLPLCVLEAMACGVPIVCTDVGGLADLVEHGENGLLFKPGEIDVLARHIARLLNDEPSRQRMSQNNIAKIKRDYSIDVIAERLGKLYNEVLGARRGRP